MLEFTSNATHMQQVCNKDIDMYRTFFSRDTGECPFLCVSTSGAADSEYIEMILASIEIFAGWYSAPARHEQDCFAICE